MKKRIIAFFLALSMLLTMTTACGSKKQTSDTDSDKITRGELLSSICDAFGMDSYQNESPYISSVSPSNPYFAVVQMCAEWNIIDKAIQDYDVEKNATRGELAIAVVNATGLFTNISDDDEKIDVAAKNNLIDTSNGKVDKKEEVSWLEAQVAIQMAKDLWANTKYEEVEDCTPLPETVDLTSASGTEVEIDSESNALKFSSQYADDLSIGSVYLVKDEYGLMQAHRVGDIQENTDGVTVINDDADLELSDVFEELHIQNSIAPDLTAGKITDGTGHELSVGSISDDASYLVQNSNDVPQAHFLGMNDQKVNPEQLGIFTGASLDFTIDGVKIKGKITSNSVSFTAQYKINDTMSVSKSYKISDFSLDGKIDYSLFSGLEYAKIQANYETEDSLKFKASLSANSVNNPNAHSWSDSFSSNSFSEGVNSLLKNVAYDNSVSGFNYDGTHAKGCSKSIGIARIQTPFTLGGIAGIVIEIKLEFTVEGTVELVVTTNTISGIEYMKGAGIRSIGSQTRDVDLELGANTEVLIYAGVVASVCGFNVADVGIKAGVGASASSTVHVADYTEVGELAILRCKENSPYPNDIVSLASTATLAGTLKLESCTEATFYAILRITAGDNSIMGKIVKANIELYGEKNAKIGSIHMEDGVIVDECTRKYRTDNEDTEEAPVENDTNPGEFDHIDISTYSMTLNVGDNEKISIIALPEGYSESDVTCKVQNSSVADCTNTGLITAKAEGDTTVIFATTDGKYNATCAIHVEESYAIEGSFLSATIPMGMI